MWTTSALAPAEVYSLEGRGASILKEKGTESDELVP